MRAVFRSAGGALETKQMTLATAGFAIKTKVTRRAQFLAEMDRSCRGPDCWRDGHDFQIGARAVRAFEEAVHRERAALG